jgi:2-phospho-L-lactate/phosphoenolpyruvate guanylyltransferase
MTWATSALVEFAAPRLRPTLFVWLIFVAGAGRCRDEHGRTETINQMCFPDADGWRLIVPVKGQLTAKSRLHPPAGVARADLAHAFALDTITAAVAGIPPGHLVVVTSDEHTSTFVRDQGGIVVADQGEGLNPAIRLGIGFVERVLGPGPTAVLLGDIPTLRPQDLINALAACAAHPRAMVPDASGLGTVLLSALSPRDLHPHFGPGSARAHSRECVRLDLDLPALRTDVDDDQTLRSAITIGVGRHTALVLRPAQG